jgi:hypothetical protein
MNHPLDPEELLSKFADRVRTQQALSHDHLRVIFAGGFLTGVVFSHSGVMGFTMGVLMGAVVTGDYGGLSEYVNSVRQKVSAGDFMNFFEERKKA